MPDNSTPLVSVIIPAYQASDFIADTLESVLAQTLQSWECLVVDDGSTDGTGSIVSKFTANDPRIRCITRPHRGLPAARNEGIRLARGKYLQFLDADDKLDPGKMEKQAQILQDDGRFNLIYGEVAYFGESIRPGLQRVRPAGSLEEVSLFLVQENIAPVNCFMIETDAAIRAGLFDEQLNAYEDWDLWLRCALMGLRFRHEPDREARAWVRLRSASMIRDKKRMLEALVTVRRKTQKSLTAKVLCRLNRRLLMRDEGRLAYAELKTEGVSCGRILKVARAALMPKRGPSFFINRIKRWL